MLNTYHKVLKKLCAVFVVISIVLAWSPQGVSLAYVTDTSDLWGEELLGYLRELGLGIESIILPIYPEGDKELEPEIEEDILLDEDSEQVEEHLPTILPELISEEADRYRSHDALRTQDLGVSEEAEDIESAQDEEISTEIEEGGGNIENDSVDEDANDLVEDNTSNEEIHTPTILPEVGEDETFPEEEVQGSIEDEMNFSTSQALKEFVIQLSGEQIMSLENTTIHALEEIHLGSLLSEEQLQELEELQIPAENFSEVGPMDKPVVLLPSEEWAGLNTQGAAIHETIKEAEGLQLDKTATWNLDGTATIKLEAYTTGTVSDETISTPVDVVLVLDQSGSMANNLSGKITRLQALKSAATDFVNKVREQATNQADHRIAIVGFASGSNRNYNNTGIYIGKQFYKYNNTQSIYQSAFQSLTTDMGHANLIQSINSLQAEGATRVDLGMELATKIFTANTAGSVNNERKRVVIVLTDGSPTNSNGFEQNIANAALSMSKVLKESNISQGGYGATVYSIGILPGADAGNISQNANTDTKKANKFLHLLSSNYLKADSMNYNYQNNRNPNGNYYLTAGDTNGLNEIFDKISQEIESSDISLGQDVVIKDIMSPYFQVPSEGDVTIYTKDFIGGSVSKPLWGANQVYQEAVIETMGNQVNMTGFDFDENYIRYSPSEGYKGKKVVIEFTVEPIAGFIGGNNVPTNGQATGIYKNNTQVGLVAHFPRPIVNIPIQYYYETQNQSIYATQTVEKPEDFITPEDKSPTYYIGPEAFQLGEGRNDFVTISYEVKDSQTNETVGTYTVLPGEDKATWVSNEHYQTPLLLGDAVYTVEASVTSNTALSTADGKPATDQKVTQQSMAYVYTPSVRVQEGSIYLGEEATAEIRNDLIASEVTWRYPKENQQVPEVTGEMPVLEFTFKESGRDASLLKSGEGGDWWLLEDTDLDLVVRVIADETAVEITELTDIKQAEGMREMGDTTIRVKTGTVTLVKTVEGTHKNEGDESFLLEVVRTGNPGEHPKFQELYGQMKVSVGASSRSIGEVTITGLPVGMYTVAELTDWSGRYKPTYVGNNPVITSKKPIATIQIQNQLVDNQWLSFETHVSNVFQAYKK